MTNFSVFRLLFLGHRGLFARCALVALLGVTLGASAAAQGVPVTLAPVPIQQLFDQNGVPLAFGCIFSYASNTTSSLTTYTDSTGQTANQNPAILSGSGTYSMWLQAGLSYTLRVKSSGGMNCANGSTLATINGVGGGVTTLATVVAYSATPIFRDASQNQLFEITLTGDASSQPLTVVGVIPPGFITWQITQDSSGGHVFSWPANAIGGCTIGSAASQVTTQFFVWNGGTATATGPCVIGYGPALNTGAINATGNIAASGGFTVKDNPYPAITGGVNLATLDTMCWRNFINSADDCLSKANTDDLVFPNGFSLGAGTVLATSNQSGTGSLCMTTNCQLTTPALNGVTVSGTPSTGQSLTATSSTAASWSTLLSAITFSKANPGYIQFPSQLGGLIVQYGYTADLGGSSATITFPLAFPNACFTVTASTVSASNDRITYLVAASGAAPCTQSGFTVADNGSAASASWIAIGW